MTTSESILAMQLKETCRLTGARWCVCLQHKEAGWDFCLRHGLTKLRLEALTKFLQEKSAVSWLSGAISSGRIRSRQVGELSEDLGCQRLYIFPNLAAHSALLVGANGLDKQSEGFFRILALNIHEQVPCADTPGETLPVSAWPAVTGEIEFEHSFDPEQIWKNVLESLVSSTSCDSAWLSIRAGDVFRIETVWNYPVSLHGMELSIQNSPLLSNIVATRDGLYLDQSQIIEDPVLQGLPNQPVYSWMGIPVVIGQRVIGCLGFAAEAPGVFNSGDVARLSLQVSRLAYMVENAIVLSEVTRYLQQLALLNELASAASLGADTQEVASRVIQRLRRTFYTERVGVFLFPAMGKQLQAFGLSGTEQSIQMLQTGLIDQVVNTGLPVRYHEAPSWPEDIFSALAVPLKYRGRVIGALSLEGGKPGAFSQSDEQLLVLIASHLAGLFENIRLSDETRQRANNLSLIHAVVQEVVGLTDLRAIAKKTVEILVQDFSAGMASVILPEEDIACILFHGKGFLDTDQLQVGISSQVLTSGKSRLLQDVSQESGYVLIPGWQAGSELCVPLTDAGIILGVIDVQRAGREAYTENDLVALEALAGVLSSVVVSARRYRELQDSVRQLQAVRETALDIAGDLDLDALLERVVSRVRELSDAEGAELGLIDEQEQVVMIRVSETPWFNTRGEQIPFLAGVAGRMAAFGEPLVVPDYNRWSGRLYPEKIAPFKTVMGVPLKFRGHTIGTLTVMDSREEKVFRPEDLQLLEMLAPQVTAWIRNARLYQELQETMDAQRLAENRLVRSARMAAVGELSAGVAHELNNPLTTVTGFVELVLEELPDDSTHRADLELVLRESLRARSVVRRLLDFARPIENQRVNTDINDLVQDTLGLVNHMARTGGVQILLDLDGSLPSISVDPGHIKQVLLNLIHNAIQAMPAGGYLTIRSGQAYRDDKDWLTIMITDTGVGIAPENLVRIFEPFFTTRPAGKGTGLGLWVSYGIVTEHGGTIEVESTPGKGSCFSIFLPLSSPLVSGEAYA